MQQDRRPAIIAIVSILAMMSPTNAQPRSSQTAAPRNDDARMQWWRDARFGLFIHWGLYSIPAGEWNGQTNHAEWIRQTAQIPIDEYDKFVNKFNPTRFNAEKWVRIARDAGMKYIVVTTKHHDGFCLFDSAQTDFDVMSTPFKHDVMKELADACHRDGMHIGWYYSIMDWHHPDYLPRRSWEKRSTQGADFNRYVDYLKHQVKELLTHYGPIGVMWFDGEWEQNWTHERGLDLYRYVRTIQPDVIVNNRVDKGRSGMAGMTSDDRYAGDFGTPEQEIPTTGLPGVDWETCMTMNDHWGYNKHDDHWKSSKDLIRKLVDVASKGGNFLLNVGPKPDGTFPQPCIDRLAEIGRWMDKNGDSIHGTQASPFKSLSWGRCTQRRLKDGNTRLYLHVFDWPAKPELIVPGIYNKPLGAFVLSSGKASQLHVARRVDSLVVALPPSVPDSIDSVIALDIAGEPDINDPPEITAPCPIFISAINVTMSSDRNNIEIRYTLDGSEPTSDSPQAQGPIQLTQTTTIRARAFRNDRPVSATASATFTRVKPQPAEQEDPHATGVNYEYYEGEWSALPDFDQLSPVKVGSVSGFDRSVRDRSERYGIRYTGLVTVPNDGVYTFQTRSDDGSRLYIGDTLVVDNDGLHGTQGEKGLVALAAGAHPIVVTYFNCTGDEGLEVSFAGPGMRLQPVPATALSRRPWAKRPRPSPRQHAWQQMELQAFVHFGMNTFTDREWGDGTDSPSLFNPTDLDASQWVRIFKQAGMKQVILTAKHHDGFCLWPSQYTDYSVKSSPWRNGKGDVVRELSDACREAGLKFGVYLSPWDRHERTYGTNAYNDYYVNQLTELLTNYGPIHEVWFDGACGEGPNGKKQVYDWNRYFDVVRRLQPDAVIFSDGGPDVRWVGNESGFADTTNWSTLDRKGLWPGMGKPKRLVRGEKDAPYWVPAECDVSIRPGWFYHSKQDNQVKTVDQLLDIYDKSVGRNGLLLLNVPADRRGLISDADARRLSEFRAAMDATFAHNLAKGKPATDSDGATPSSNNVPANAVDGDPSTAWKPESMQPVPQLIVDMEAEQSFDRAAIQEDVRNGQRIRKFRLDAWTGNEWQKIAEGTTIGHKRLLKFDPVRARRVRLTIGESLGIPAVSEFGLYKAPPATHDKK